MYPFINHDPFVPGLKDQCDLCQKQEVILLNMIGSHPGQTSVTTKSEILPLMTKDYIYSEKKYVSYYQWK